MALATTSFNTAVTSANTFPTAFQRYKLQGSFEAPSHTHAQNLRTDLTRARDGSREEKEE